MTHHHHHYHEWKSIPSILDGLFEFYLTTQPYWKPFSQQQFYETSSSSSPAAAAWIKVHPIYLSFTFWGLLYHATLLKAFFSIAPQIYYVFPHYFIHGLLNSYPFSHVPLCNYVFFQINRAHSTIFPYQVKSILWSCSFVAFPVVNLFGKNNHVLKNMPDKVEGSASFAWATIISWVDSAKEFVVIFLLCK